MMLETQSRAGDVTDQTLAPRLTSLNGAPLTAGHSGAAARTGLVDGDETMTHADARFCETCMAEWARCECRRTTSTRVGVNSNAIPPPGSAHPGTPIGGEHTLPADNGRRDTPVEVVAAPSTPRHGANRSTKSPRSTPRRKPRTQRNDVTAMVVTGSALDFSNLVTPGFPSSAHATAEDSIASAMPAPVTSSIQSVVPAAAIALPVPD